MKFGGGASQDLGDNLRAKKVASERDKEVRELVSKKRKEIMDLTQKVRKRMFAMANVVSGLKGS